ncbi:MAG TPA: ROK family protein [Clostridiaceae bacterium]|nr:ROK family protein [Clostridiaceae bacterium]
MSYYLGLDIGGSYLQLGLVTETGDLLAVRNRASAGGFTGDELTVAINEMIIDIKAEYRLVNTDILALGAGVPGHVDNKSGYILHTNNLSFNMYPLRQRLNDLSQIPVYLANDATLATLAESRLGAGQGYSDLVMITIGTGIGGGIVLGGKIYTGYNQGASELGHHVIMLNGELCSCGRRGCFEAYASATALIRMTKRAAEKNPDSYLAELITKQNGIISGKTAFLAQGQGDVVAATVIDEYLDNVAEGCANIINILMPELMILGGGISQEGEDFLQEVARRSIELAYLPAGQVPPRFALASLGNEAGVIGAALFAAECRADKIYG